MRRRRRSKRGGTTEEKLFGKIERKRKRRGRGKSWESPARFGKKIETVIQGAQVSWVQGRKLRNIGRNAGGGEMNRVHRPSKIVFWYRKSSQVLGSKSYNSQGWKVTTSDLVSSSFVSFFLSFLSKIHLFSRWIGGSATFLSLNGLLSDNRWKFQFSQLKIF